MRSDEIDKRKTLESSFGWVIAGEQPGLD
jgi:hypothetical protein